MKTPDSIMKCVQDVVDSVVASAEGERQIAVRLHDFVRDEIAFGFTPFFDAASAEQTLQFRTGHCNPQARLMVKLFRLAGLSARYQPVTINNEVLRGVIHTPRLLSHVFTEIRIDGEWRRLDSYIVDPPLRKAAVAKLESEVRELGYGCHVSASGNWTGAGNCFSQVATRSMILELHEAVDNIEDFYGSTEYRHRLGPFRYTALLAPARFLSGRATRAMNARIERLRRTAF